MPGGASLPAAAGLGTTKWDLRTWNLHPWEGRRECRAVQSSAGVCSASPPGFWDRSHCGVFRKVVLEEICGGRSLNNLCL